jgi:ABC-type nickel/cobalt efflux system permease component RcnA
MILAGMLVAFGLGAVHALSPGHGKTIVAAYLVGSRGTVRHAALLGFTVTFTHTISVFVLGLGVLFFQEYVVPERVIPILGALSGLAVVAAGAMLLYQRSKALMEGAAADQHAHVHDEHSHEHDHSHAHSHGDGHSHEHAHAYAHAHANGHTDSPLHQHHGHAYMHSHPHSHSHGHVHSHGGRPHSHMPEGPVTLGSLIALGVSGGLVPCPSALVLMLSSIALGHAGFGLILLTGFSAGLAAVLMTIGILVIYAKHLLPARETTSHPFFRLVPVFSAVVVICLGLGMTAVSLGWVQPARLLG